MTCVQYVRFNRIRTIISLTVENAKKYFRQFIRESRDTSFYLKKTETNDDLRISIKKQNNSKTIALCYTFPWKT